MAVGWGQAAPRQPLLPLLLLSEQGVPLEAGGEELFLSVAEELRADQDGAHDAEQARHAYWSTH